MKERVNWVDFMGKGAKHDAEAYADYKSSEYTTLVQKYAKGIYRVWLSKRLVA